MNKTSSVVCTSALVFAALAISGLACGPPALPAGPKVKPPGGGEGGKYQCKNVTGASDPWLVEWDPAAKVRLHSSAAKGVLLVKYQGCSLEVLHGCEVKGSKYAFVETPRARQTEHIGNEAELFAKLPIGALNLAAEFHKGDRWSLDYVLVGTRNASLEELRREAIAGRCAGATHFVGGMAVGAYQLSAGAKRKVGAEASIKGVGGAGGKIGAEARRLRQDGQFEKCVKDGTDATDRGCQAIVKLYLQPLTGYTAVAPPPVPGGSTAPRDPSLPPVGAELGHLRVEGSPRRARVDVSGPSSFSGPRAVALPHTWQNIPAGSYRIKVQAEDRDPYQTTVTVLPDRTKVVAVVLQKTYGQLTIGGTPAGARVELAGPDGFRKVFGLTASFTFPRLRRGSYTVKVTRTGYTTVHKQLRVAGGQTTRVAVKASQVNSPGGSVVTGGGGGITWVQGRAAGLSFGKSEVTLGQYRACVKAGVCKKGTYYTSTDNKYCNWGHAGRERHPMNCVNWHGADAFCRWAGGRLPTEQEWFAEASNGGTRAYPWGSDKATCAKAIMNDGGDGCGKDRTWPVCSKPAGNSAAGLCDMSGNVWEWTSSKEGSARVLRGGGWYSDTLGYLRCSARVWLAPDGWDYGYGFRCVRSSH